MKSFKFFFEERKSFDASEHILKPSKKYISLVIGRFSPFHLGHLNLIKKASYPVIIGIIKGKKSSLDKERNPFPVEIQKEIIKKAKIKNIKDIYVFTSANLVEISDIMRENGYEIKELICGSDRYPMYNAMVNNYSDEMNWDINVIGISRNANDKNLAGFSGTKVREALRNGDYKEASRMTGIKDIKFLQSLTKFL